MYPATSLHLLDGANLVHHFMSGAHAEAKLMDVPVIYYRVPQPYLEALPGQAEIYRAMVHDEMSRDEYMKTFFTYDDCRAGERVMDVVETFVERRSHA